MVRTRFAPSPTGYLHIGGVRTALFNWLFAKKHGGLFILRIDDTDQSRNIEEALEPILEGFRWLGIDWDEGPGIDGPYAPYYQSQRSSQYQAAVDSLLKTGDAYRDFATAEEVQAEREAAEKSKQPFVYSRRWMAESPEEASHYELEGRSSVVRLKMPREGSLTIPDLVRGDVQFDWAREQDHVIQRADGSFIYHLATVVDDHDFQISHVIRAEEHLSNTPRQVFIAQALGYELPKYAHVPFVAEPGSKTKLSKRKLDKYLKHRDFAKLNQHGQKVANQMGLATEQDVFNPVIVDFYEQVGFLPEAVNNYLLLLGWSLDDKTEFFTREEMIREFSLDRVNKAAASFDPQKLLAFQQHYMNELPTKQKTAKAVGFLQKAKLVDDPPACETGPFVNSICEAAGDRIMVSGDILDFDDFFRTELSYDEKAFEKRLTKAPESVALLTEFCDRLSQHSDFSPASLETLLKSFVQEKEVKIGQIIHALRVALTGKAVGFGMFETLSILGKEVSIERIRSTLKLLENSAT